MSEFQVKLILKGSLMTLIKAQHLLKHYFFWEDFISAVYHDFQEIEKSEEKEFCRGGQRSWLRARILNQLVNVSWIQISPGACPFV